MGQRLEENIHYLHEASNVGIREPSCPSTICTRRLPQPQLGARLVLIHICFGFCGIEDKVI